MEELSRMVALSMARNGCNSTVDHRRLAWSPWIRCEWDDSLLRVPSAAGILALAEDVGALGFEDVNKIPDEQRFSAAIRSVAEATPAESAVPEANLSKAKIASDVAVEERRFSAAKSELKKEGALAPDGRREDAVREGFGVAQRFSAAKDQPENGGALAPEGPNRRILALFEIAETDDLGAALVRLFAPQSGYRERLRNGRCFMRFTPVPDRDQRQTASRALREWLHNSSNLEATPVVKAPETPVAKEDENEEPEVKETITAA
jgi:hypothetical protein